MKYKSARVTITGRVFVPADEIGEQSTPEEEKELFVQFAKDKIDAVLCTDEPMKVNEIEIDLDTYNV